MYRYAAERIAENQCLKHRELDFHLVKQSRNFRHCPSKHVESPHRNACQLAETAKFDFLTRTKSAAEVASGQDERAVPGSANKAQ